MCITPGFSCSLTSLNSIFLKSCTNIYNFIDSLLVQDVHSYFVTQKGKKNKLYDDSCLGMLAYEMVIILMGTTNSMDC